MVAAVGIAAELGTAAVETAAAAAAVEPRVPVVSWHRATEWTSSGQVASCQGQKPMGRAVAPGTVAEEGSADAAGETAVVSEGVTGQKKGSRHSSGSAAAAVVERACAGAAGARRNQVQ